MKFAHRRPALAALAVALGISLTACSSGQNAGSTRPYNPTDGRNVTIPDDAGYGEPSIAVRNLVIVDDAVAPSLIMKLVNTFPQADVLEQVTIDGQPATITDDGIALPPGGAVSVGVSGPPFVSTTDLTPTAGRWVPVTLSFASAGTVELNSLIVARRAQYLDVPLPR